jgi:hypothetical protein
VSGATTAADQPAFSCKPSTRMAAFSEAAKNSDLTAIRNLLFVHAIAV